MYNKILYTPWVNKKSKLAEFFLKLFKPKEYKEYVKALERQHAEREKFLKSLSYHSYKNIIQKELLK